MLKKASLDTLLNVGKRDLSDVYAITQGIDKGLYDVVKNGVIIKDQEEFQPIINHVLKMTPSVKIDGNGGCKLQSGETLCSIQHPIKDVEGRTRITLVLIESEANIFNIKNTVEKIGLEFVNFKPIYEKSKKQKKYTKINI